ncbi:hypothetical protein C8J57DRAFT_1333180, partial [Mycena rebaudengoi]
MSDVVNSADFDPAWALVLEVSCLGSTTLVLYGLYVPMFILSIQAVNHHNPPRRRLILATTSLMFILGTGGTLLIVTEVGLVTRFTKTVFQGSPSDLSRLFGVFPWVELTEVVRFTLNNLLTDLLLLYRCYTIWGSKKKVIIVPAVCILLTVVFTPLAWVTHPHTAVTLVDSRAPYIMNLATNLLLVGLIAGRIWHIGRQVRIVHEGNLGKQYTTAIALLLESGALYCLCLILWVVSLTNRTRINDFECIFSGITAALVGQTVNIAPTVMLVRAGRVRWPIEDATSLAPSEGPAGGIVINSPKPETSYPTIEI